jgi:FAD/FMN-containing dehydrogenase
VVIVLTRLNRIRAVDADNNSITVEAGCTLHAVQEAAREADRLFPLSLAAEGSATIGGNLPPMPAACRCCATATPAS